MSREVCGVSVLLLSCRISEREPGGQGVVVLMNHHPKDTSSL